MPVTDLLSEVRQDFIEVGSTALTRNMQSNICYSNDIILSESVMIHDENFETNVPHIHACDVKLKRLIKYWSKGVLSCCRFPLV